jgi:hypothetical protein
MLLFCIRSGSSVNTSNVIMLAFIELYTEKHQGTIIANCSYFLIKIPLI